jgi:hypothetical protein
MNPPYDLFNSFEESKIISIAENHCQGVAGRMRLKDAPPIEKIFNYAMAEKINAALALSGWKP